MVSGAVKALVYFKTSLLAVSIASGALTKTFVGFLDEFIDVLSVHMCLEFFESCLMINYYHFKIIDRNA